MLDFANNFISAEKFLPLPMGNNKQLMSAFTKVIRTDSILFSQPPQTMNWLGFDNFSNLNSQINYEDLPELDISKYCL